MVDWEPQPFGYKTFWELEINMDTLPYFLYAVGSLCFLCGSIIVLINKF